MAYQIRWSPQAVLHLESICEYITKNSEIYAILFAKRINQIIKSIPLFPNAGRIIHEYNDEHLREKIYKNYRIVYRIKQDLIEIVTIIHSAKLLKGD
jgi:plasmid stabilization system protein ParE